MNRLTGAIIGCGAIGREHLIALSDIEKVDIVAVCDISPARAQATAERFNIAKWTTNYQELLSDVRPDLVHVATPPSSHVPITSHCLKAGLNILCEKPLTVDYSEFDLLKQLAIDNRCMLLENQQFRLHSSIRRMQSLLDSQDLGDLLEVQICLALNITAAGSPYIDPNAPHYGRSLPGGVIGDFLPHIAYLAHVFAGRIIDVRSILTKHKQDTPLSVDEFRGLLKGERATAYVSFSGNARPDAFLVRLIGTRMRVEANLFEPPRLTIKRSRKGEPALMSLVDGIAESRDVFRGSVAGLYRKLGGTSSYDGLREFIAGAYRALASKEPQPISLEEIGEVALLVNRLTRADLRL